MVIGAFKVKRFAFIKTIIYVVMNIFVKNNIKLIQNFMINMFLIAT